jgi:hypothetical protein
VERNFGWRIERIIRIWRIKQGSEEALSQTTLRRFVHPASPEKSEGSDFKIVSSFPGRVGNAANAQERG